MSGQRTKIDAGLRGRSQIDLRTSVGSVDLANPVMTASGTAGHGSELSAYVDLSSLGAVVVKSLAAGPWPGNPPPRLAPAAGGMLNSVGLQGPGLAAWIDKDLPALVRSGATVVVSIWGRRVDDFATAAAMLAGMPPAVVAVEVNVSCPNLEDRRRMFAHSPRATGEAVEAARACQMPLWVKLSPNVADLCVIAQSALDAGASGLTLVNTAPGMAIDVRTRRARLGGYGGGLSGPAIHPIATRAVFECRAAFPDAGIIGAGGVRRGVDAVELLMAGADAVQVGTATLANPRAPGRILGELVRWCRRNGVVRAGALVGAAHRPEGGSRQ